MSFPRSPLEKERARLTAIAHSLIGCRPLAQQAVNQAFLEYLYRWGEAESIPAPALLGTILTAKTALTYAGRYHKKAPDQLLPPPAAEHPEDLFMAQIGPLATGMLLLCAMNEMTVKEAAALLGVPENSAQIRYQAALEALGESGAELENAVKELQHRVKTYQPVGHPKTGKKRENYKLAALLFAFLDITCLLSAVSLYTWSHSFLKGFKTAQIPQAAVTEILPTPLPENMESLDHLFYELTALPPDFQRTSHIRSEIYAHYDYANKDGDSITFTQQVSAEPVLGFSSDAEYESISFRGHPAALRTEDNLLSLFWFNDDYCYTLTSNLDKETTIALAESARIGGYHTQELQAIPLHELPMLYTPRLSSENDDIQIGISSSKNTDRIKLFLENHASKKVDAIRIVEFDRNGNAVITDLETFDGLIYCTRDSRRANSGVRQERGAQYKQARMIREKGKHVLLLENGAGEGIFAAASYS